MRIIYSYEASGVKFQEFEVEVPTHLTDAKKAISREEIILILSKEKVRVNQSSILSYYNESTGLFMSAEKGVPVTNTVHLLIRNGVIFDSQDIHSRILKLEEEIQKIQGKLENRILESGPPNLLKKSDSLFYYSKDVEIDLAMLFSAPIVVEKGGEISAFNDPSLEFERFKRSLIGHLENKNVGLNIKIDCGMMDTLVETLYSKPKILLLYCHGHYTSTEGFIVGLESTPSHLGVLDEVSTSRLRNIVRTSALYQNVIIVYSNLAQEIGRIFLDAGFNCVVCIQASNSDTENAESFFVYELIRNLLKGDSIKSAYGDAEIATQERYTDEIQSCCCAHLHKTSCSWVKSLESSTSYDAHLAHVPTCNCANRNESNILHSTECSWALGFLDEYNDNKRASDYELKIRKWHICCCSPEMNHSKLKFHLMISDERVKDQVLYDTSLRSAIEIQTGYSQHLKPPYSTRITVGRRTEMHALITSLKTYKCVQLNGQTGVGKTLLAKRVAQYAYERNMFRDGVTYLDYRGKTDILFAYRLISSALQIPSIKTKEELCNEIKNLEVLFVIDNIEFFVKESKELILETLRFFLDNTQQPKFLILSENSIPIPNSHNIHLNSLTEKEAAELLLKLSSNLSKQEIRKPKQTIKKLIEEDKIISCIGTLPSSIHQVATQLKYKTITEILRDYDDARIDSTHNNKNIDICLKNLEAKVPGAIEFFKLLSCLPSGFLEINMKFITSGLSVDYKKILGILINEKNPRISNTWLIHQEKYYYAMSNSVSSHLLSRLDLKAPYSAQCVIHLGAFARAVLNNFIKQGTEDSCKTYLSFNYRGSMMFINAGINVGIWKEEFEVSANIQEELEEVMQNLDDYITKIEGNYWYFIDENRFFNEFEEGSVGEELKRGFKEMVICFASVLAINGKHSDAIEILRRGIVCFHRMNVPETEAVLKIMLSSQLAYAEKDHEQAYSKLLEAEEALKLLNLPEELGEVYLLKALLDKRMHNTRAQSESIAILSSRDYERHLNDSILNFTKINNSLGIARAQFLKFKWKIDAGQSDDEIASYLLTCLKTFEQYKFYSWQERVHIYISDCFYHNKQYFKSKDHLMKAQLIANKIKDYYQSAKISHKISQTYEIIRKKHKNNFSVLKAAPLVDKDEYNNVIRIGPPFRSRSVYKSSLTNILSRSNSPICVRFGVLTKDSLKEHLFAGCKVLQISSKVPNNEYINVEDEDFVNDVLTIEDIEHLVGENLSDYGLNLLILAMPYSDLLAEKFKEKLHVPNVIGFDLPQFPVNGENINLYNIYEQAIEDFNLEFFTQLIETNDIQASFHNSKRFIESKLADKLRDELLTYLTDSFISVSGRGPVLISDSKIPNQLYFPKTETETEPALIDMSNSRAPFNLPPLSSYFIGRNMEMHNVVKALKRFQCVHLIGCEGIGKTDFLHHLGCFLSFRNYFHDGIFYIDIQGKSSLEEINLKLQERGLLSLTQESLVKKALSGKKLLLLVDNCDAVIKNSESTFFRLYQLLIKECNIYILFSSNLQLKDTHLTMEQIPLRPMSTSESLCLFQLRLYQSYRDESNSPVTRSSFRTVLEKVNKNCQGIPKKIVYWTKRFLRDDYERIALELNLDRVLNGGSEPDSPTNYIPTLSLKRSSTRDERSDRFQEWEQPTFNSNSKLISQNPSRKSIEPISTHSESPFLLAKKSQKPRYVVDCSRKDQP